MPAPFQTRLLRSGFAGTLALLSGPALADLTPQDVAANWEAYLTSLGYDLTATPRETADGLIFEEYRFKLPIDGDVTGQLVMDGLRFEALSADDVRVELPEGFAFVIADDDPANPDVDISLGMRSDDLDMIASGTPDNVTYNYAATEFILSLDGVTGAGLPKDFSLPELMFSMQDLEGSSRYGVTDNGIEVEQTTSMSAATMAFAIEIDEGEQVTGQVRTGAMSGTSRGILPEVDDLEADPAAFFASEFDVAGAITLDSFAISVEGVDDGAPLQISAATGPFRGDFEFNQSRILYDFMLQTVSASVLSPDVPLPVAFQAERYGFKFELPLTASDAAQPAAIALDIAGLALPDTAWDAFDPTGTLPRGPVDFVIDLTAQVKLLANLFDEAAIERMTAAGTPPMLPESVSLNALRLAFGGAVLEGDGTMGFVGAPSPMVGGLPAPEGQINLDIKGANALLDKLIAMGAVADDEAMGFRMMMGLLAVPVGEDHLQSTIEMNTQGHIIANGQRIQ